MEHLNEPRLVADGVRLAYDGHVVVDDLTLAVPDGRLTAIVGPNACGKSTVLRALAGLHQPTHGRVLFDGQSLEAVSPRRRARAIGVLPQRSVAPAGVVVADLVARGRHPHRGWFGRRSADDDAAVTEALVATGTTHLAERPVDQLSGGQAQRVWLAMVLAQRTDVVLLDEPTTYLDVAHQLDLLELLAARVRDHATTVVMVLHELNLAARYADHLVVLRDGRVLGSGSPAATLTPAAVEAAFVLDARVVADPVTGTPMVVPVGRPTGAASPSSGARR